MSKIIFVGDPHLDNRTPLSRADDYSELTLDKLGAIKNIAIEKQVKYIIFTGDMFDKDNYDQPLHYINKIIAMFKSYNDAGIQAYSLIGNHDMKHNKMEYFQGSPLNILFQTGFVKHLTKLELSDAIIYGIDFTELDKIDEINKELNPEKYNIIVQHYAVNNTIPNESISFDKYDGINLVVSGHDHNYYEPVILNNSKQTVVLRPGSMIRRTRDAYNLTRTPLIYEHNTTDNTTKHQYISNKKAEQVFKTNVIFNESNSELGVHALFTEQYFKRETLSLKQMIEDLPQPISPETKRVLLNYIVEQGIEN